MMISHERKEKRDGSRDTAVSMTKRHDAKLLEKRGKGGVSQLPYMLFYPAAR